MNRNDSRLWLAYGLVLVSAIIGIYFTFEELRSRASENRLEVSENAPDSLEQLLDAAASATEESISQLVPPIATLSIASTPAIPPSIFVRDGTPVPQPVEGITAANASQVVELARWGYGAIENVLISEDEETMFVQTSIGMRAYRVQEFEELWKVEFVEGVHSIRLSPSQELLGLSSNTGVVYLMDARTGQIYDSLATGESSLEIAFSPAEDYLLSGGASGKIRMWTIRDNQVGVQPEAELSIGTDALEIFFIGNGEMVGVFSINSIFLLGFPDLSQLDRLPSPNYHYYAHTSDFNLGWLDPGIYSFDVGDYKPDIAVESAVGRETSYAFSDDGSLFAIGFSSGGVRVFDVDSATALFVLGEESGEESLNFDVFLGPPLRSGPGLDGVFHLDFSADGRLLAATNGYGVIDVWTLGSGQLLDSYGSSGGTSLILRDQGQLVSFSATSIEVISIDDYASVGHWEPGFLSALMFFPNSRSISQGFAIRELETALRVDIEAISNVIGFSSDGERFFAFANPYYACVGLTSSLDLLNCEQLERPDLPEMWDLLSEINGISVSPDGGFVAAGSYDSYGGLWNLDDGSFITRLGFSLIHKYCFSPDGLYLVDQGDYQTSDIYRLSPEEGYVLQYSLREAGGNCAISDDNRLVALPSEDGLLLVKLSDGTSVGTISVDVAQFYAFSPDGTLVAVINGNRLSIWDVANNQELVEFDAPFESITGLDFSPDGRFIVTSGRDGLVRLWGIAP